MRKLIVFNMISLDGYFEGPNHDINWHTVDEEFNQYSIAQLKEADTLIFGRTTYELMASYWPTNQALNDDPDVAKLMNEMRKVVFSTTLTKAEWNNSEVMSDLKQGISKLKHEDGSDMFIFGSSKLCVSLINIGFLEEVRVMVSPVLLGKGTTLFEGIDKKVNLELIDTKVFKNGNVLLRYKVKY